MYETGVAKGNGTEEERSRCREILDGWDEREEELMREQLKLSTKGHYVRTLNSGHNLQMTEPEFVAGEIRWVLERALLHGPL